MSEFIAGPNFSGRSAALLAELREKRPAFFVGPYAEAALSGLSSTVADEVAIYHAPDAARPPFAPLDFTAYAARKPPTLSGGEQVLLALHCFSLSDYRVIGIDTALEQLDPRNCADALAYLSQGAAQGFRAALIDNRLACPAGWARRELARTAADFACDLAGIERAPCQAPAIGARQLSFRYPGGREIFRATDFRLAPGQAYRLTGPNGAGKTTLFKLLAGVLRPTSGTIMRGDAEYRPWRGGNRLFALAAQNPDHQWCGATLGEDLARRRAALARSPDATLPSDAQLAELAARLGVHSMEQHLYELPLVARKRVSWLWPLAGAMPWVMFDEPTLGQDQPTRAALAQAIGRLAARGYGVLFVTHDDAFAGMIAHRPLRLTGQTVQL
jgi:energy-coupling factor transporter ATP-binding protein EcfA2